MNEETPDRGAAVRAWALVAVDVGLAFYFLYLTVPSLRLWTNAAVRDLGRPWREHRQRQAEQRAMMADVVELVATGRVPEKWLESA